MANTYHHAPNHIRRMLNQLLFEHVYLVPHDDTSRLAATAACMPPFDSILGLGGDEDGNWSSGSTTGLDENKSQYRDQSHTPQPPGTARTLPVPRGHEVAGGHEIANTRPGMQPPNQQSCPKPPKTVQNKPCSTQKPTSEVSQDVGLSVEHLVGVAGFEPTTSSSRTKRATKLRHTPCAAGDSIASPHRGEEIGSAESSVTSVFAPRGNPVGPGRPPCQAAHGRSTCWPTPRSALVGPDPVARGPLSPEKVLGPSSLRSPSKHPPQTRSSYAY